MKIIKIKWINPWFLKYGSNNGRFKMWQNQKQEKHGQF